MNPMRWMSVLSARRLSRKGEHARAIALSRNSDAAILARAGMYLSALQCRYVSPKTRLESLVALESVPEALAILSKLPVNLQLRPVLGRLAVLAPASAIEFLGRAEFADLRNYCSRVLGEQVGVQRDILLSPMTALMNASARGDTFEMARQFDLFFSSFAVEPPKLPWTQPRIEIDRIPCAREISDGGSNDPKVSIVLTVHNEERYLEAAAISILAQSWRNIELIIVDDGSTDDTYTVAQKIAHRDRRVVLHRLNANAGTWIAKNHGLQLATGAYLTMHDADDWSHPEKIRMQITPLLANAHLQCTSSYMVRIHEKDGLPFTRNAASYLRWNPSSLLFRRSVLTEIGDYFPNMLGADCEYAARIESRWSRASHLMLRLPLSLGWQRVGSLSDRHRGDKGGLVRLAAWETWRRKHARAIERGQSGALTRSSLESYESVF